MNAFIVADVAGGSALGRLFAGAGYETVVETKSVAGDQLWKELVAKLRTGCGRNVRKGGKTSQ